jgi:hypothetical protein
MGHRQGRALEIENIGFQAHLVLRTFNGLDERRKKCHTPTQQGGAV